MLSVDQALERVLDGLSPLPPQEVALDSALGRVLAEEVVARGDVPHFASSAMDGYAVRAVDVASASAERPSQLRLVGEASAGHPSDARVGEGEAVAIATGAPIPAGADAVVQVEWTRPREGAAVVVERALQPGTAIRLPGEDVRRGERLYPAGWRLGPADLALLAALNQAVVLCHTRPRVALLTTGDELIEVGGELQAGQIIDTNRHSIAAQIGLAGAEAVYLGRAPDDPLATRHLLAQGLDADLLITSAGVSVGEHDHVKEVLQELGRLDFWRVAMRPGKPLAFGRVGGTPVIGLPGNPVSSMLTFEVFARPAIARLAGLANWRRPKLWASLDQPLDKPVGLRLFARARIEPAGDGPPPGPGPRPATLAGGQGSHVLSGVARANIILVIPESVGTLQPGTPVEAWWLGSEWGG